MKLSPELQCDSPKAWVDAVMNDFDSFLQDHADCERKASAMAMSFVAKYPDRLEIIAELIETSIEELEHFQQVYDIMQQRNVPLSHEIGQDLYMKALLSKCRTGREERFIDRMCIASVVECRGAERFRLVYENIEDENLKKFYHQLWASEAKHGNLFVKLLLHYFDEPLIYERLQYWVKEEAEILISLEIRPALH